MRDWMGTLIVVALLLFGCNDQSTTVEQPMQDIGNLAVVPDTPVMVPVAPHIDTIFAGNGDSNLVLQGKSGIVKGHMQPGTDHPAYSLILKKGQTIIATVRSIEKGGNVRINQIQKPDQSFDGPFGDSLHFTMPQDGTLRILTGQNMMAGDPWSGDFLLQIRLLEAGEQ